MKKFAAVETGTEDFGNGDCWYFNDAAKAEKHAAVRLAKGVICEVREVPRQFVEARIAAALAA